MQNKNKDLFDTIIKILILAGLIFGIFYFIHLQNEVKQLKMDLINVQLDLRDSLIAEIQKKNQAIRDSVIIYEKEIKYFEKDTKDYENFLKNLPIDSLVKQYWNIRSRTE